jgi:hypothetical protein
MTMKEVMSWVRFDITIKLLCYELRAACCALRVAGFEVQMTKVPTPEFLLWERLLAAINTLDSLIAAESRSHNAIITKSSLNRNLHFKLPAAQLLPRNP